METTHYSKRFITALVVADLSVLLFFIWYSGYIGGLQKSALTTQATQAQLLSSDAKSIFGKIIDISGTTLTMTSLEAPSIREVTTDAATVFEQIAPKDQKVFQSEIITFDARKKTAEADGTPLLPSEYPSPFAFQKLSLSDLRVGDIVTVTATDTILSESTFTATRVSVQSSSAQ